MFLGAKKIGFLYIGRGYLRYVDVEIAIGLWPRRDCPEGEIAHHLSFDLSWDWLPPRIYHFIAPPSDVAGSSAAWTGREYAFAGFDWSRWHRPRLSYQYIKD